MPIDSMNVRTKFEIRSFTRSRDRGTQKYGQSLDGSAPFHPIPFRQSHFAQSHLLTLTPPLTLTLTLTPTPIPNLLSLTHWAKWDWAKRDWAKWEDTH